MQYHLFHLLVGTTDNYPYLNKMVHLLQQEVRNSLIILSSAGYSWGRDGRQL